MSLRFGYSFWGFLADRKFEQGNEISAPDGNAAYSWSVLWEAQQRGWDTWLLQRDRDLEYVAGKMSDAFESFSTVKRYTAWKRVNKTITTADIVLSELPELDVLLIEWRWPIIGRNYDMSPDDCGYQPDLDRQTMILEFYKERGTKIIIWDLDHKLTLQDEVMWNPDAIFETSVVPRDLGHKRTRVEPPIVIDDLLQFATVPHSRTRKLVYVGSRYERDDVIDKWIKPISNRYPWEIEFWGNWTREPNLTECRDKWPTISYNRRITMIDFREVYSTAVACPILAKESYFETGFMTPRPWEALMFGTIPIGLACHNGIEDYVEIVAESPKELTGLVTELSYLNRTAKDALRKANVERLRFMDVANFVDKIEDVTNG